MEEAFRRLVARLAAFSATPAARRLEGRAVGCSGTPRYPTTPPTAVAPEATPALPSGFCTITLPPRRTGSLLGEFADTAEGLSAREEQLLFAMLLTPIRAFEIAEPPGRGELR